MKLTINKLIKKQLSYHQMRKIRIKRNKNKGNIRKMKMKIKEFLKMKINKWVYKIWNRRNKENS